MVKWTKKRRYRHFDFPISAQTAKHLVQPSSVSSHSFLPLIRYEKIQKWYKRNQSTGKRYVEPKRRDIMYASHNDACILSFYAEKLNLILDKLYSEKNLNLNVIGYRKLGKSNYNFVQEALDFCYRMGSVSVVALDVTSFFDSIDHKLLKQRLKNILAVDEIPLDWYKIFKFITEYRYVNLAEIKEHPAFKDRFGKTEHGRISTIRSLKKASITIHSNSNNFGIPQGTPISAALSNLYMVDFDIKMGLFCKPLDAFYRRYSDDILIICAPELQSTVMQQVTRIISEERLRLASHKTVIREFNFHNPENAMKAAQYLGYAFDPCTISIRSSSLSRQWQKMRKAFRRSKRSSFWRYKTGILTPSYKKKLNRRFRFIKLEREDGTHLVRNFSSYCRRKRVMFWP